MYRSPGTINVNEGYEVKNLAQEQLTWDGEPEGMYHLEQKLLFYLKTRNIYSRAKFDKTLNHLPSS